MNDNTINILISGVGGQGVLLASEILAATFASAGNDVKMSAVTGMSQRGGSVLGHIRIGRKIHSPLIPKGKADILIAMELLEISSCLGYLKRHGLMILLDKQILSGIITPEVHKYINDLKDKVRKRCKRVLEILCDDIDKDLENKNTVNIFILGILSNYFSVKKKHWLRSIREKVSSEMSSLNLAAFELGRRKLFNNGAPKVLCGKSK